MQIVNILCIGDSLTAGYCKNGTEYYPYSDTLYSLLKEKWADLGLTIHNLGTDGQCVNSSINSSMISQLRRHLQDMEKKKEKYDVMVILGGSNDLGGEDLGLEILQGLQKLWRMGLRHGAHVLAVTIPQCADDDKRSLCERQVVNEYIRVQSTKLKGEGQKKGQKKGKKEGESEMIEKGAKEWNSKFHVIDLENAIPYHGASLAERRTYWEPDGLHFTKVGYMKFGQLVAQVLEDLIDQKKMS